jgi:hypothetical protein
MKNGAYLLPARRHQVAFHALIMKLNRRLGFIIGSCLAFVLGGYFWLAMPPT